MLPPRGLNRKGNGYAIQPFASIGIRMGQALDDLSLDQEHPDGTVARASGCKLGLGSGGASTATSIRWRPTSSRGRVTSSDTGSAAIAADHATKLAAAGAV